MYTSAVTRQRRIRGFVVAWLGITLLMGALTFAGIYYATGLINNDNDDGGGDVSAAAMANDNLEDATQQSIDLTDINATTVPTSAGAQAVAQAQPGGQEAPQVAAGQADGQGGMAAQDGDAQESALVQDQPTATPVPSPTPLPVNNTKFQLGIQVQQNPDPVVYRLWMGEVRDKLKLGWIKTQVRWEDIEPAQGDYQWGALDVSMDLAAEFGNKVMVSVVTAPEWAREPGAPLDKVGPPADPQTYANFLTQLLTRYRNKIHAVEVWNEMNIDREWASTKGLSAANYVTMLRTAYSAIKAVDPGIIVISGALSPTGYNDGVGAYDDFVYMDMLIQAGMLDTTDCVGAHHNGYNIGPNVPWNNVPNDPTAVFRGPFDNAHHSWSFYSTLNGYAQKIQQAGSTKALCITEFGWPVTEDLNGTPVSFEFADDNTLQEQAQFFGEAVQLMQDWGFVWLAFIWNLNYGPQAGWDASNDNVPYSLLRPDYVPAPAYEKIAQFNFRGQ
jgi:hypothetical protein